MARPNPADLAVTVGETLFLFEGDVVRIYGRNGTEATFPLADLEAFVECLIAEFSPPAEEAASS